MFNMFNSKKEPKNWEAIISLREDSVILKDLVKSEIVGEIDIDTLVNKGVKVTSMLGHLFISPVGGWYSDMSRVGLTVGGTAHKEKDGPQRLMLSIDLYLSSLEFFLGTPDYQHENEIGPRVSVDFRCLLGEKYTWHELKECQEQNKDWSIKAVHSKNSERSAKSKFLVPWMGGDEMIDFDSILFENPKFKVMFRRV